MQISLFTMTHLEVKKCSMYSVEIYFLFYGQIRELLLVKKRFGLIYLSGWSALKRISKHIASIQILILFIETASNSIRPIFSIRSFMKVKTKPIYYTTFAYLGVIFPQISQNGPTFRSIPISLPDVNLLASADA